MIIIKRFEHILTDIIIVILFLSTHSADAQTPQDVVTVHLKSATLATFIEKIEQSSGYRFIYGEDLTLKKPITISAEQMPLEQVLRRACEDQPFTFAFRGSHILLKKDQDRTDSKKYTLSGIVTDAVSGETLIGANIYVPGCGQGTATNEFGFYSLTLPEGEVTLRFSYVGHERSQQTVLLDQDVRLNVKLKGNTGLGEITVTGDREETGIRATQMGAISIPMKSIRSTPALLGEADVMKTIQLMPGVQAGTEGTAGIYIRGGGPDENLILLDGIPLYHVDHLVGLFSVFTPEAVKNVNLFKSSFPARFGGRLSSVVDVRTNDGDMRHYHGTLGIGLLSSKFHLEGPLIKDRTSFVLSGRRSYLDLMIRPFMPEDEKGWYLFYDLNAKINHQLNDRHRLFVSFYNGRDRFVDEFGDDWNYSRSYYKNKVNWGNTLAALRWNWIISPRLFANTTLAYTKYRFNIDASSLNKETALGKATEESNYASRYVSGIDDWACRLDFDYHPLPEHTVKFGLGYLYHAFQPEVMTTKVRINEDGGQTDTTYNSLSNSRIYAHEASVYAEDNFRLGPKLDFNAGIHSSMFHVNNKAYYSFQPRLSAKYQFKKDWALKGSYTKMSQYIHLLSAYNIISPSDLWVPTTENIKPMRAHQVSAGIYYTGIKGWEFSMETYYKKMNNVLEYKEGASFFGTSQNWQQKVEMGKGRAYGTEWMARKTAGRTTGWMAYTLSRSERKFGKGGINNGAWFPYRYDRRHHVVITANHRFSERIDFGLSWEFYTGGVTTIAAQRTLIRYPVGGTYSYLTGYKEVDYIEGRNNYRVPSSHRLNVGFNFNKKKKHGVRTWNISVYNCYNAMNPAFVYSDSRKEPTADGWETVQVLKKVTVLPLVPSVSYIFKF